MSGYPKTTRAGKTVLVHRLHAEAALGKPLPPKSVVHHAASTLVICESQAYHMLLHERMRIRERGGNPNTDRVCCLCHQVKPIAEVKRNGCRACTRPLVRAAQEALMARRRAAGECIACGVPADGFVRCKKHRDDNLAAQRKSKAA